MSPRHPSEEALWESARAGAPAPVEEHVTKCPRCAEEVRLAGLVVASCRAPAGECLGDMDLVLAADGMLRDSEALRHVEACAECARHVESLRDGGDVAPRLTLGQAASALPVAIARALAQIASTAMPVALQVATRGRSCRDATIDRGVRAYRRRRFGDAARELDAAFRAGSESADSALLLGACLRRAGRRADAIAALRRAAALQPALFEPRWHLAQALLEAGDGDAALTELERLGRKAGPRQEAARAQARRVRAVLEGR
jgi:tetratricopeptide (TPR) repeat protein